MFLKKRYTFEPLKFCIMSEAEVVDIDCVEGVEVERTTSGRIRFVRIDLDTHPFVVPILRERGLVNGSFHSMSNTSTRTEDEFDEEDESWLIPTPAVEVDCRNIKWSKKLLRSFEQAKNGQLKPLDLDNFWNFEEEAEEVEHV